MLIISKKNMKNIVKVFKKLEYHKSPLGDAVLFKQSDSNKDFCNISMMGNQSSTTVSIKYDKSYGENINLKPFTYSLDSIENILKAKGDWVSVNYDEVTVGSVSISHQEYAPHIDKFLKVQDEMTSKCSSIVKISYDEVKELMEVSHALAKDDTRPILKGVCFGEGKVAALDGYRLSVRKNKKLLDINTVISPLPFKALAGITGIKNDDIVIIYPYGGDKSRNITSIEVTVADVMYTIDYRPLEGDFISYDSLIPSEPKYTVSLNKVDELKAGLDMLCSAKQIVTHKDSPVTPCVLKFSEGTFSMSRKTDKGIITYRGTCTGFIDDDFAIAFNGRYLKDAIADIGENFFVELNSRVSPMVLRDVTGNKIEMVLPVRMAK